MHYREQFDISEINDGDKISLGGFMNFVHKKDKNNSIQLKFNVNLNKNYNTELMLLIGIKNSEQRASIQKIIYMINNDVLLEIENNLIKVNIEHDIVESWISKIKERGNWQKSDIDNILKDAHPFEYKDEVIDFLSRINEDEYDFGREELKEKFLSWTKAFENQKKSINDINKRRSTRDINFVNEKEDIYDFNTSYYLLNEVDVLSLKNILIHMAVNVAIDINTNYQKDNKNFMYIGPLRFYPERYSAYQENNESRSNSSEAFWSQLRDNPEAVNKLNKYLEALSIPYTIQFRKLYNLDFIFDKDDMQLSKDDIENKALFIEELVFIDKRSNTAVHNREMGLGVTQLLPILGNSILLKDSMIAIEQPELHLHPKLQTEIADIFIGMYKHRNNDFLIETHSEHLLLRIMRRMRHTAENKPDRDKSLDLTPDDICLLYIDNDGESTFIKELRLSKKGTLLDHWPQGFFEEGYKERFS